MRQRTKWSVAAIIIVGLVIFEGFAQAAEVNEPDKPYKGEVQFRYDWLGVNKNRARFREDNWIADGSTGGLDWLHMESTRPDKNGYEWSFDGRAMYDYDYEMSLLMKKRDSHYLKLDFSGLRRYYDGSDEGFRWTNSLNRTVDDGDLFVDRRNYNIELGLTPPEGPQWVFGWHRLEKDGKEVLLREARNEDNTVRAIPDIVNMRGITDTIYGEVSQTFADKYNLRVRQEFEQYHDNPYGGLSREFDNTGTITSNDRFRDNLGYTNWRTMVMFDSFLDKQTYVTADYMFNYLTNDSTRTNWRPAISQKESDVDNSRTTNVYGLGYRRANFIGIANLDLSAGIRIEDSKTDSDSNYGTGAGLTPNTLRSNLDELRVAEVLRLVYKGINKTTLSVDAQLEQRDLDWDSRRTPDTTINRKADIYFMDQIYTFKAVHRFNRDIKSTVAFRIKDLYRNYTELIDLNPGDYPGWLGDYRIKGDEISAKTDFRLNRRTNATLSYQFIQETIDFDLGGRTSDQEIHRGSASVSFDTTQNLFLVGTFMIENRDIDTPAVGTADEPDPRAFDFRGNSYSLLLDAIYAFNEKTSCTLGFRHTKALANMDASGDYVFDKAGLTLKHRLAANQTVSMGYQFYTFNNRNGNNLDYRAHGAFVTYGFTF